MCVHGHAYQAHLIHVHSAHSLSYIVDHAQSIYIIYISSVLYILCILMYCLTHVDINTYGSTLTCPSTTFVQGPHCLAGQRSTRRRRHWDPWRRCVGRDTRSPDHRGRQGFHWLLTGVITSLHSGKITMWT